MNGFNTYIEMEIFSQPAVVWFIIGFVLFLLEFVLPGLILFFFGLGAWIVALVTLFFDITVNEQLIIFVISSVLTIFLLRSWVKRMIYTRKHSTEILEDEFLGKIAKVIKPISPDENGTVAFKGTVWQAASQEYLAAGQNVIITGNESILLLVTSSKPTAI